MDNKLATLKHRIKRKKEEEEQIKEWASAKFQEEQAHYFERYQFQEEEARKLALSSNLQALLPICPPIQSPERPNQT